MFLNAIRWKFLLPPFVGSETFWFLSTASFSCCQRIHRDQLKCGPNIYEGNLPIPTWIWSFMNSWLRISILLIGRLVKNNSFFLSKFDFDSVKFDGNCRQAHHFIPVSKLQLKGLSYVQDKNFVRISCFQSKFGYREKLHGAIGAGSWTLWRKDWYGNLRSSSCGNHSSSRSTTGTRFCSEHSLPTREQAANSSHRANLLGIYY